MFFGRKLHTPFSFWLQALQIRGSAVPLVVIRVLVFTVITVLLAWIHRNDHLPDLNIPVAPYEAAGAVLGLLMVLRTNSGYERWWEARKLWGSMVNTSRSLGVTIVTYGPKDPAWRDRAARRVAAFGHAARRSLRGQAIAPELVTLLGAEEARFVTEADHMPSAVARLIAESLREGLAGPPFLQADALRVLLIDNLGGCERIAKTPLPQAYTIEVRRFIFLFLFSLPFVLFNKLEKSEAVWLAPLIMILVSYPLLAIDKIAHELQDPFQPYRLNHLPLDDLSAMIERNVLAIVGETPALDSSRTSPIQSPMISWGDLRSV